MSLIPSVYLPSIHESTGCSALITFNGVSGMYHMQPKELSSNSSTSSLEIKFFLLTFFVKLNIEILFWIDTIAYGQLLPDCPYSNELYTVYLSKRN